MAEHAHVDVVDTVAAMLVERAHVARQALAAGVDDIAAIRCGAAHAHEPIEGRRRDTCLHGLVGIVDGRNERLAPKGDPATFGIDVVHRDRGRRDVARAGRVVDGQLDIGSLARRAGRLAKDEVIALCVVAVCTDPVTHEEHRLAGGDSVVARIDPDAVVGGYPGDRQVDAVIGDIVDPPDDPRTFAEGGVDAINDLAVVSGHDADGVAIGVFAGIVVEIGHDDLAPCDAANAMAHLAIGRFRVRKSQVELEAFEVPACQRAVAGEAAPARDRHCVRRGKRGPACGRHDRVGAVADAAVRHVGRIADVVGIITCASRLAPVGAKLAVREVVRVVDAVHDSEELHVTRFFVDIRGCRIVGTMADHAGVSTDWCRVVPAAVSGCEPPDFAAGAMAADTGLAVGQAGERNRSRIVTDRGNLECVGAG